MHDLNTLRASRLTRFLVPRLGRRVDVTDSVGMRCEYREWRGKLYLVDWSK